jgi:hypothetical protein
MNKHKMFLSLAVISLLTVVSLAAGCAAVAPTGPAAKPTINSFTASPASISSGQRATLSWDVSGATTINIQPGIGDTGPSGSLQLSPPDTITYTLTATNKAGSSTGSVTLTVTPAITGEPDLVITDISLVAETVYFTIKNQGDATAGQTWTNMYIYDNKETSSFVDALAPGEERTVKFSNWRWRYPAPTGALLTTAPQAFDVRVCADANNAIEESNKANNCLTVIWGQPFIYDFTKQAHLATWRSSAGKSAGDIAGTVRWGGLPNEQNGAAYILTGDLYTCPEKVSNGWILGRFADFYSEMGVTRSRDIEVPPRAVFVSEVGFGPGAKSSDGVRVALGYLDETFSLVLFPKMDVYSDGQLHTYRVDLSALKDMKTEFFLWVEAKDSPEGDCVKWVNPRITQE